MKTQVQYVNTFLLSSFSSIHFFLAAEYSVLLGEISLSPGLDFLAGFPPGSESFFLLPVVAPGLFLGFGFRPAFALSSLSSQQALRMGIYGLHLFCKCFFDNLLGEQVVTRWLTTGCFNRIASLRSCLILESLYIYRSFSKHQDNKNFIQEYLKLGHRDLVRSRSHLRLLEDYVIFRTA